MASTSPEFTSIKEFDHLPESIRLFLFQLVFFIINTAINIEMSEQTLENIAKIDQQLETSSIVAYGYHNSIFDALILPMISRQELKNLDKLVLPITINHTKGLKKFFLSLIATLTDSEFLTVIRKKDEATHSQELKRILLRHLIQTTKYYLEKPGNMYGVAPMGTRSQIIDKQKVNNGFIKVAQKHQVPLVPIAFTKTDNHLEMSVGEILPYPEKNDDQVESANFYMNILAQMIPYELRGDYS